MARHERGRILPDLEPRRWIWSLRWTVARGWAYVKERECTPETAVYWLALYKGDEPEVTFRAAAKAPRLPA
jgi:hypothetical protein